MRRTSRRVPVRDACAALTATIACALVSTAVMAAGGDAEAGRRKTVTCNACHGQASMQSVPNLGGQSPAYFVAAMRAYQDGKRGHATMRDVAKAYSDKELKNFAAYYAQFGKGEGMQSTGPEVPAVAAACEACHGQGGRVPVNPESPILAGQKPSYLKAALKEYRDGTRKHAVMQAAASQLADPDIETLEEYYARVEGLTVK